MVKQWAIEMARENEQLNLIFSNKNLPDYCEKYEVLETDPRKLQGFILTEWIKEKVYDLFNLVFLLIKTRKESAQVRSATKLQDNYRR